MEHVQSLCDRVIILSRGKIVFDGNTEQAIYKYYKMINELRLVSAKKELTKRQYIPGMRHSRDIQVLEMGLLSNDTTKTDFAFTDENITVYCLFQVNRIIQNPRVGVAIRNEQNIAVISQINIDRKIYFKNMHPGTYRLTVTFFDPKLVPNIYRLFFSLKDADTCEDFEKNESDQWVFQIVGNKIQRGFVECESSWDLKELEKVGS